MSANLGLLDAASDPARGSLFTELVDEIGELVLAQSCDELHGGLAAILIHSHVDRTFAAKAHPSVRMIQLQ